MQYPSAAAIRKHPLGVDQSRSPRPKQLTSPAVSPRVAPQPVSGEASTAGSSTMRWLAETGGHRGSKLPRDVLGIRGWGAKTGEFISALKSAFDVISYSLLACQIRTSEYQATKALRKMWLPEPYAQVPDSGTDELLHERRREPAVTPIFVVRAALIASHIEKRLAGHIRCMSSFRACLSY